MGNLKSVGVYPQVMREKVFKEVEEGRVEGPFESPPFRNFRISPLGVMPKREPGSFCIIHHLSFPKGGSLNDDIDGELCSVLYVTFEEAIIKIRSFGTGALLAKANIKSDFRLLPIFPAAFNSFGFYFDNCYFFDKCPPMGCFLSCSYFEAFSIFLHWVLCGHLGPDRVVYYLDNFLFIGPPGDTLCFDLLQAFSWHGPGVWYSAG